MPSRIWSVPPSTLRFISAGSSPITFASRSATVCRMSNVGLSPEAKVSRALVRQWEAVVHVGVTALDDTDELSLEIDEAKRAIETTLRPFVEAPTFSEFLLA